MERGSARMALTPDDLAWAATVCGDALAPALGEDWSVAAGDLAWDCRRTLDHVADALMFYAGHLAARATAKVTPVRNGDPERSVGELLTVVGETAAILAGVARAAPVGTRAFHPAGMADVEGFVAMGCVEMLIHTDDMTRGLGRTFRPPDELTRGVVQRLFPWAPTAGDPWEALRWACGRASLGDRERLEPDWYWQCAPLAEWDGTVKKRTAPPGWR